MTPQDHFAARPRVVTFLDAWLAYELSGPPHADYEWGALLAANQALDAGDRDTLERLFWFLAVLTDGAYAMAPRLCDGLNRMVTLSGYTPSAAAYEIVRGGQ